MSFIEELKRRNVFRVAVAYLVTAWLSLQAADIVLENIEAPGWIMQVFMLAIALGFPVALVLAWAFELTPEGLKKEKDVDRSESITRRTGRKLDFTIIGVLVVAVGILLADKFMTGPDQNAASPDLAGRDSVIQLETGGVDELEAPQKSIAVLPFVNMSSDPEQEYFSDGISEEILNALAQVKGLKVAGRTSSFAFKGKNQDLRQIGDTLGVEHILEGSVRKSGMKVRITAQLIQVDDGFHLWSDTYDRELTDVFAIQDEIAGAILEQLKAQLIGGETTEPLLLATRTDSEVYDQYLLARQRIYERKRLSIEAAVELLDRAIAIDPAYAPAYAQRGISAILLGNQNYGDTPHEEAEAQGKLYLDKALQLDSRLAEGWAGLGLYHSVRPGEHQEAIENLERALSINPNLIDASNWLQVMLGATGDAVGALRILENMVDRDPLYPPGFANAVYTYNLFGLQEKSQALLDRVRPFMPNDPQILQAEARTWLSLGQPSKAIRIMETALAQQPSDFILRNVLTFGLLQTGQYEKMVEQGNPWARAVAHIILGQHEEARIESEQLAAEGTLGPLFYFFSRSGQSESLVQFVEQRWADLDAFEADYPHPGNGYSLMLQLARAYSKTGNETRFADAMERVRSAHDRSLEQGIRDKFFLADDARYWAMAGDRKRAIELLEESVEMGLSMGQPMARIWGELDVLTGDPRFEAAQSRMFEHLNAERAKLGLDPISA
jgi:TolB-like protein